jgi:hypothetical protein
MMCSEWLLRALLQGTTSGSAGCRRPWAESRCRVEARLSDKSRAVLKARNGGSDRLANGISCACPSGAVRGGAPDRCGDPPRNHDGPTFPTASGESGSADRCATAAASDEAHEREARCDRGGPARADANEVRASLAAGGRAGAHPGGLSGRTWPGSSRARAGGREARNPRHGSPRTFDQSPRTVRRASVPATRCARACRR